MKKFTLVFSLLLAGVAALAQTKSYTFVFLNNKPDKEVLSKEKSDSIMQGHMNNIGRLAKEGKLLAAGPFEGGGGIFILNTTSVDEANQWLATDPGVKAKRWNLEVLPYTVKTGGVCPVGEKFEMVFYQFLRFTAETTEKTEDSNKVWDDLRQKYKGQDAVIHMGLFGNNLGGIIIAKPEVIVVGPTVEQGKPEIKKLYIAKGSFCEK
jgi:uncharacterized protein YciI